jgi:hypothetical protein
LRPECAANPLYMKHIADYGGMGWYRRESVRRRLK